VLQRRATTLRLAALMAAGVAMTGLLAYLVPIAADRDLATLNGFLGLNRPRLEPIFYDIAGLADPAPYAVTGLALALWALARRRRRVAVAIPVVLVASGATTQVLKHVTAAPRFDGWLDAHIADASWPSGHATAAMTLALCAVLASPPRWRGAVAAAGVTFAVAVSFSILALGWHFPSDVLGGYLVAAFYALLAVAAVGGLEPSQVDARPAIGVAVAAALAGVVALAEAPGTLLGYASSHPTFIVGAAVIAALATALGGLLAAGLRPRSARG
jgi:membrane-associated phospholipid phosphatase